MRCFVCLLLGLPNSCKPKHRLLWRAFSGSFHAGAIAPVYLPWGKLGPNSLPQQLSYSCIHWLVDPENTGSMLLVQFITLCSCSIFMFLSHRDIYFKKYFLLLYPVFNSYVRAPMEQGRGQYMNLQCHLTRHFSMQWNFSKKIQKEYQMLLGRDFFFF